MVAFHDTRVVTFVLVTVEDHVDAIRAFDDVIGGYD
jgi:hypothetical protein